MTNSTIKIQLDNIKSTSKSRILSQQAKAGFILISATSFASKSDVNYFKNGMLESQIQEAPFAYIPFWGGFGERDIYTGEYKEAKEKAFMVLNYEQGKLKTYNESESLKAFGMEMASEYEQRFFVYRPMNEVRETFYLTPSGEVDQSFTDKPVLDLMEQFLVDLKTDYFTPNPDFKRTIYFKKSPGSLAKAYQRYGEMFIDWGELEGD